MKSNELRVLLVEDSEDDAQLLLRELRRSGLKIIWERVDTGAALAAALARENWDVILSDYSMPQLNALNALQVVRRTNFEIPFIIVSGTIGEEVAVRLLKAGANDYLMKGNLTRLQPSIERELREAQAQKKRRQADERLRDSEERYRALFERNVAGIGQVSMDGRIVNCNENYAQIFGYDSRADLMKHTDDALWFDLTERDQLLARLKKKRTLRNVEVRHRRKDGQAVWTLENLTLLVEGEAKAPVIQATLFDITKRKQAERTLFKLKQAVNNSGEVVFMTNEDGIFTLVNPEFTRLYGHTAEETVGRATPRILKSGKRSGKDYANFWDNILKAQVVREEIENRTKKGELITVESSTSPILDEAGEIIGFLAIQRDITEHKKLEAQFRQAQKMEAIGRLAGGIAHDFNNLLTVITGFGQLVKERLEQDGPLANQVEEIIKAGNRAAALTRQLLSFSRKQVLVTEVLSIDRIIENIHPMLSRIIGEDIELDIVHGKDVTSVRADPGQIEQVIMNLVVNARDAMPQGGRLTIETATVELDDAYSQKHASVRPGRYSMFAVNDSGTGMDAETQSHIFEPFFTTKEQGKGTGLGLSTVYGIVKQSGGSIWVYSEPGLGSTFKIYLPIAETPAAGVHPVAAPVTSLQGSETVLLVEDEASVRLLARNVLEGNGYRVLEARDGAEAIEMAKLNTGKFHLLLTDVVMPKVGGQEVAKTISALNPGIRVLFTSGYTDDSAVRNGLLDSQSNYLQKPFTPETLARKVREVLDAER